ncbi:MAG: trypsin-like peptidase domain-containing protein [Saprospiraceae bacterium]|jgi:S1-C subfamily serine protease|nr:trypsin-like peptidase domain-containing protein [Saprospiraceae bacterium]
MIKQLASYVAVAFLSAFFAFMLFQYTLPSAAPALQSQDADVQFTNYQTGGQNPALNVSPKLLNGEIAPDFRVISRQATASVVNITSKGVNGYRTSSGSGVIMSSDGFIITNNHVLEDGNDYEITLHDKRKLTATVIGVDPTTDLALIKVNASRLQPVVFGNSDQVEVGEWVLAVGNPFNLNSTVTAGIVSAKARNISILRESYAIESFIQTDAVVNPGNSGGALINAMGELIGINTAIMSESGAYEGYSFAIPSNLVRKVFADLREFGSVKRAILGVRIDDVTDAMAREMRLPSPTGVFISDVTAGSSAQQAGLKAGDVIISINSVRTGSVPELQEQIALYRPGDRISLEYFRDGKKITKENLELKGLDRTASTYRR